MDDIGDTIISPGPFGVSGNSAYKTEIGVSEGVPRLDGGEVGGGVKNRSFKPERLTRPADALAFCEQVQIFNEKQIELYTTKST